MWLHCQINYFYFCYFLLSTKTGACQLKYSNCLPPFPSSIYLLYLIWVLNYLDIFWPKLFPVERQQPLGDFGQAGQFGFFVNVLLPVLLLKEALFKIHIYIGKQLKKTLQNCLVLNFQLFLQYKCPYWLVNDHKRCSHRPHGACWRMSHCTCLLYFPQTSSNLAFSHFLTVII